VLLGERIPLRRSFSIVNISYILNGILPARLGEVARAFLATRVTPPIPVFTSLSTILAERIIDMLTVILMLGGALLAIPNQPAGVGSVGLVMGAASVAALGTLITFAHRPAWAHTMLALVLRAVPPLRKLNLDNILDRVLDGLRPLARWRTLLSVLFWTAISWSFSVLAGYLLMFTLYSQPRLDAAALFIAAASLVIAVPATFASVGPYEWSIIVSIVAVYGVNLHDLPGDFVISPLAQNPGAINALMTVQSTAFSFALIVHVLNVSVYAVLGAIGLIQEGISLSQVTRGAERIGAEPPLDLNAPTQAEG
jgi:hypothetical protein